MIFDIKDTEYAICPHCGHEYLEDPPNLTLVDRFDTEYETTVTCEKCNKQFYCLLQLKQIIMNSYFTKKV